MHYIQKIVIVFTLLTTLNATESSLNDLINIALQNNTSIKSSQFKQESQKANIDLSKSNYLPKASLTGEIAKYNIESTLSNTNDSVRSVSLNLNQLIYDFGKTNADIEALTKTYEASMHETISIKNSIVLSVKQAYYDILNQQQLIQVALESIKIDTLQLEQAKEYFKAGVRTQIDVTNAKLQLSNSQLDLIKEKYSLKLAKTKLTTILGVEINSNFDIKMESKDISLLVKNINITTQKLDKLIELGIKNRPETVMYYKLINAQKLALSSIKKEYYPKLDFDASYANKSSDNINIDSKQWTAGIYLKWNFYTGDSTKASLKDNLAKLQSIQNSLKQQKLTITQEVTNAYFSVKENEKSIKISSLNVQLAIENLNLAKQRYKAGLNDLVEFNDAKLSYTKAKSKLVNIYYNYRIAKANLTYTTGQ